MHLTTHSLAAAHNVLDYLRQRFHTGTFGVVEDTPQAEDICKEFKLTKEESGQLLGIIEACGRPVGDDKAAFWLYSEIPETARKTILNRLSTQRYDSRKQALSQTTNACLEEAMKMLGAAAPESSAKLLDRLVERELKPFVQKLLAESTIDEKDMWTCPSCQKEMPAAAKNLHVDLKHKGKLP